MARLVWLRLTVTRLVWLRLGEASRAVWSGVLPADAECELLWAVLDSVLGLHVGHELGAVAVDGKDGVTRTQVALGRLAARRYLQGEAERDTREG